MNLYHKPSPCGAAEWIPLIPTCHLLIRSMTSRVNILTSCSSSISWDSGLSSAISSSPLPRIKRQVPWESKGSKNKKSNDNHQHPCPRSFLFWLYPGLYSKGTSGMDSSPLRDVISCDSAWLDGGSGSKSRVGKGKERLISTSGHSLVTAYLDTNHLPCKLGMTIPLLVLG